MSTVVQPQLRVKVQEKAEVRVSLWDLVRAEVTRSRRTLETNTIITIGIITTTVENIPIIIFITIVALHFSQNFCLSISITLPKDLK